MNLTFAVMAQENLGCCAILLVSLSSSLPMECQYESPQGALVSLWTVIAVAGCSQKHWRVHLFISPNSPRQDKRVKNTVTLADCSALLTALHLIWGGCVCSSLWNTWKKCRSCLTQGRRMPEASQPPPGLLAAAAMFLLRLAALVWQCELPTPNDQGG